jgi:hypothetical protein
MAKLKNILDPGGPDFDRVRKRLLEALSDEMRKVAERSVSFRLLDAEERNRVFAQALALTLGTVISARHNLGKSREVWANLAAEVLEHLDGFVADVKRSASADNN